MATLTSKKIQDTYKDLLQVSNSNSGVDTTLRDVEDGEGTASALKISTTSVQIAPSGTADFTFAADLFTALNGSGIVVGHTAQIVIGGSTPEFQVLGTSDADSAISAFRTSADASGANLRLGSSRDAALGSFTIVQSGDELGSIEFVGDDGVDQATVGASISAVVSATPGANDMPTKLVIAATHNGAATPTSQIEISENGSVWPDATTYDTSSNSGNGVRIDGATGFGRVTIQRISTEGGSQALSIYQGLTNTYEITAAGTAGAPSDAALKDKIRNKKPEAAKFKSIALREWEWKDGRGSAEGVVADELETLYPDMVYLNDNGVKFVKETKLIYKVIEAVQDIAARVEALEA